MEEPRRLGGRYELRGVLGRGGMAEVYLADDTGSTAVAVKTLRAEMGRDPRSMSVSAARRRPWPG